MGIRFENFRHKFFNVMKTKTFVVIERVSEHVHTAGFTSYIASY